MTTSDRDREDGGVALFQPRGDTLAQLLADPVAANHYRRLLELLKRDAYRPGEVRLASGKLSDFYIDCRPVALSAEGHLRIGSLICTLLHQQLPAVRAVGGLTLGADPLASATATISALGPQALDAFYVRKEPKGHGTSRWVEGPTFAPGCPVVVLEDVVTSGGSALQAVERARSHGLTPLAVVALVDRLEGGGEAICRELPLFSLYLREDFADADTPIIN